LWRWGNSVINDTDDRDDTDDYIDADDKDDNDEADGDNIVLSNCLK